MTAPTPESVAELRALAEAATPYWGKFGVTPRTIEFRDAANPATIIALCDGWEAKVATVEVLQQSVKRWQAERDALKVEVEALKDKYERRCQSCHEPNPCGSMQVFGYCR